MKIVSCGYTALTYEYYLRRDVGGATKNNRRVQIAGCGAGKFFRQDEEDDGQ